MTPMLSLLTGVLMNLPISRSARLPYTALPLESRVEKLPVPRPGVQPLGLRDVFVGCWITHKVCDRSRERAMLWKSESRGDPRQKLAEYRYLG